MGQGRDTDPNSMTTSLPAQPLKHTAPEGHSGVLPKEIQCDHCSQVAEMHAVDMGHVPMPVGSVPDMSEKGAQNKDGGKND